MDRKSGQAIADTPGVIYVLFIVLAFPAMIYASLFYRATLVYFATRDSCYKAAKSPTFTQATANANSAFTNDMAHFNGVSGHEDLYIITQPTSGGSSSSCPPNALGAIDQNNNVYFIRAVTTAAVDPLFRIGSTWLGMDIPGLTNSYPLTISAQFYVENPTGLPN